MDPVGVRTHPVRQSQDHDAAMDAAPAARYRTRRLVLLVVLLAGTGIPIVAFGATWVWPLLVIPAVLAAPLAGGTGFIATLLAAAVALAVASGSGVSSSLMVAGFVGMVGVAILGAAHTGRATGRVVRVAVPTDTPDRVLTPHDLFDFIADRDCRRAADTGSSVSVAVVAIPRVDIIGREHGMDVLGDLLGLASAGIARVTATLDLVVEPETGRYVALVAGTAEAARDLAERMATVLEDVAVRGHDGRRVTAGIVALGVAQWTAGDTGVQSMIDRASTALRRDLVRGDAFAHTSGDDVTGSFRVVVADAA
ncbi:MAG: hypothetical protein EXQ74_06890 [Thermoleophilia bacterium]|nr:hypothetical protein [Thermoleophilia bacterium]